MREVGQSVVKDWIDGRVLSAGGCIMAVYDTGTGEFISPLYGGLPHLYLGELWRDRRGQ